MGVVCCSGFNLAVLNPSDRKGHGTYCIAANKGKTMGFIHINWVYFIYIMSSCFKHYSVCHELNTIDAYKIGSIGGVIVVDAGSFQSTCHRRDPIYMIISMNPS